MKNLNIASISLLFIFYLILSSCSSDDEIACNKNSKITFLDGEECVNGRVVNFRSFGTSGEFLAIGFNADGNPGITVQTLNRPIIPGIYQRSIPTSTSLGEGGSFAYTNMQNLESVTVTITKLDRENKLVSGLFTAVAQGSVIKVNASGSFEDVPLP